MIKVPLHTAKRRLVALVRRIERNREHIVRTRRGRGVAALVPLGALAALELLGRTLPDVKDVAAGLRAPDPVALGLRPVTAEGVRVPRSPR